MRDIRLDDCVFFESGFQKKACGPECGFVEADVASSMPVVPASSHKDHNVTRPMRLCSQMIQKSYPENAAAHGSRRTDFVQARLLVAGRVFFPGPSPKGLVV